MSITSISGVTEVQSSVTNYDLSKISLSGSQLVYRYRGSESQKLIGANGNDTIQGDDGNDTVYGNLGSDGVMGKDGNDSLDGGAGSDTVDGGTGNDTLVGGTGDDSLLGGDGEDSYYLDLKTRIYVLLPQQLFKTLFKDT
jgi:Ca2+-binding RTX toxin-like protein